MPELDLRTSGQTTVFRWRRTSGAVQGREKAVSQEFQDGSLQLVKVGPLGPFGNNAYIISDASSREAIVVDAPQQSEEMLPRLEGLSVKAIVITHRHGDHWAAVDTLRANTQAEVWCHAEDAVNRRVDATLADGEEIRIGTVKARVLFTPGHTPGSICLLAGAHLISGDTLFPGGPGRTNRPEDLQQEIESIKVKLFVLPDSTVVHPGHGDDTTIGDARREYAVFASKEHPAGLSGDVTWLGS